MYALTAYYFLPVLVCTGCNKIDYLSKNRVPPARMCLSFALLPSLAARVARDNGLLHTFQSGLPKSPSAGSGAGGPKVLVPIISPSLPVRVAKHFEPSAEYRRSNSPLGGVRVGGE